jgi:TolB-like protein
MQKIKFNIMQLSKTIVLSFLIVFSFANLDRLYANAIKKIAILPFEIHSEKDITHIKQGIEHMLSSRLSWTDHTTIADKRTLKNALKNSSNLSDEKYLSSIAKKTNSDYVLTGSITEFANAFSIDAKVYNINDHTFKPFFGQASKIDRIIPEISILAAKINKIVFDRTTEKYEEFAEAQSDVVQKQQEQRMDPEKMWTPQYDSDDSVQSPGWRFWKYIW